MLKTGDSYQTTFLFTQNDVEQFAKLTGDDNPMHLDEAYMANTPFKKPIIHGMLSASIFSRVLGTEFPGAGTIYIKQSLEFKRPMFVGITYEAMFRITHVVENRSIAVIETTVKDSGTGKLTIKGEATVKNDEKIG